MPLASSQLRLSTGIRTIQWARSPVLPGQKSTPSVMCQCIVKRGRIWTQSRLFGSTSLVSSTVPSRRRVSGPYSLEPTPPNSWPPARVLLLNSSAGLRNVGGTPASRKESVTLDWPRSRGRKLCARRRMSSRIRSSHGMWSSSFLSERRMQLVGVVASVQTKRGEPVALKYASHTVSSSSQFARLAASAGNARDQKCHLSIASGSGSGWQASSACEGSRLAHGGLGRYAGRRASTRRGGAVGAAKKPRIVAISSSGRSSSS